MYDWEISNYLQEHNYILTYNEYLQLYRSSPQIDHVKYDPYNDNIHMWSNNGAEYIIKVRAR